MKIKRAGSVIGGASPPGVAPSDAPFLTWGLDADLAGEFSIRSSDVSTLTNFEAVFKWAEAAEHFVRSENLTAGGSASFQIVGPDGNAAGNFLIRRSSDTIHRLLINETGILSGPGGASALDTSLSRAAAGRWATPSMWTFTPTSAQLITAATNAIVVDAAIVVIDPDANYTLTSVPTIANGATGQIVWVINIDNTFTVTVQDEGTLTGSNLELASSTLALGPYSATAFIYSAAIAAWVPAGGGGAAGAGDPVFAIAMATAL